MNKQLYNLANSILVGVPVTKVQNSIGSMIQIGLGQERELTIPNGRKFKVEEWCIMVGMAEWRLTQNDRYIVGSAADRTEIKIEIKRLLSKRFQSLKLRSQFLDAQFNFEGGYQLTTFFNQLAEDQWSFHGQEIESKLDFSHREGIKKAQILSASIPIHDNYMPLPSLIDGARFWTFISEPTGADSFQFEKKLFLDLYCTWRLEKEDYYVAGSFDAPHQKHQLGALCGRRLKGIEVTDTQMDARFHFEGGYALSTFSQSRNPFPWEITLKGEPQFTAEFALEAACETRSDV